MVSQEDENDSRPRGNRKGTNKGRKMESGLKKHGAR